MNDPNQSQSEDFITVLYGDLRQLASRYFDQESPGHTLQPTAIVHEAYLRMADLESAPFKSRAHFMAIAANVMRRLLVDHARKKSAAKRGGGLRRITLRMSSSDEGQGGLESDILEVHDALKQLEAIEPRLSQVVELRFFGGLTIAETANILELSTTTIEGDWAQARAWLRIFLENSQAS